MWETAGCYGLGNTKATKTVSFIYLFSFANFDLSCSQFFISLKSSVYQKKKKNKSFMLMIRVCKSVCFLNLKSN